MRRLGAVVALTLLVAVLALGLTVWASDTFADWLLG